MKTLIFSFTDKNHSFTDNFADLTGRTFNYINLFCIISSKKTEITKDGGVMKERLFRSRKEKVIGGICGGLAEYFGIDPIIIRIIFIILLITKGVGLLAYIIMWIVIPEEPIEHYYARFKQDPNSPPNPRPEWENKQQEFTNPGSADYSQAIPKKHGNGGLVLGIGLILVGVLFLFWTLIPSFDFELFFPTLLVILGGYLIFNSIKK